MKCDVIRNKWKEFIEDLKYKQYFISNEEEWYIKLAEVKKYIDDNKKKPNRFNKNINIKQISRWIETQQINYKKNIKNMVDINIKNKWKEFIEDPKYKQYFNNDNSNDDLKSSEKPKKINKK